MIPVFRPNVIESEHEAVRVFQENLCPSGQQAFPVEQVCPGLPHAEVTDGIAVRREEIDVAVGRNDPAISDQTRFLTAD